MTKLLKFILFHFQLLQHTANLPSINLVVLLTLITFHAFSLVSSSFVEEEHQTWYYFFNTFCIILFISDVKRDFTTQIKPKWRRKLSVWLAFFLSHTFARRLNQTGDKWINLPDLGDYLVKEENKMFLSFFVVFGLITVFYSVKEESWSKWMSSSMILCLASIYAYRGAAGSVVAPLDTKYSEACLVLFWIGSGLVLFLSSITRAGTRIQTLITLTVLISSLIHKPHNIVLNGLCVISCNFVTHKIQSLTRKEDRNAKFCLEMILVHFCIGKVFYFYQVCQVLVLSEVGNGTTLIFRVILIAWRQST